MRLEEPAGAVLPQAGEQAAFVPPGYSTNCVKCVGERRGARTWLVTLLGNQCQCNGTSEVSEVREQNPQFVCTAFSPRTERDLWNVSTSLFAVCQA